ncbi:hypothetical protein C8R43DRAFT_1122509 [Mycena crocata]|nr:hypothetical protein C8R43DRAFT_1122509 [Mycena crocata]
MFTASTVVRAASTHSRLALHAAHSLFSSAHDVPAKKTRFPEDVDVVLASDSLVFTLSGVLNGARIPPADVLDSQLAQHLVDYFQAVNTCPVPPFHTVNANANAQNAAELGLAPISSMYLGEDGLPKLNVRSSRCLPPESELRRVHVTLVGIDLKYVWQTESTSNSLIHPFATHLSLPFQLLLDNVICRFFTWHLVRRYPLIFGPWCQQLDVERPYFDKIFNAISNMIERSPNPSFRKKCGRMLKTMQEHHAASFTAASASLATYFGLETDSHDEGPVLTDQEGFSLSMEIRYRACMRRPQFKGSTRTPRVNDGSDDDELSQVLTPESSQCFDENYLWRNTTAAPSADLEIDFDLPPDANIERCFPLDMGMDIEYQDPSELWSDNDDDLLSLSSDDEASAPGSQHLSTDSTDDGFSLVTPSPELGLDLDVTMDGTLRESHTHWSPDAVFHTHTTRIESLSPSASSAGHLFRPGTAEACFPGLSPKHHQANDLDFELCFDSDSDLEEAKDGPGHLRSTYGNPEELLLEHQDSNGGTAPEDGAGMDGKDMYCALDEDW